MRKATTAADATRLEHIPNVGVSIAGDLRRIGIDAPQDLVGKDPYALFEGVCAATGTRHDPCLIDAFISAVRFMDGAPAFPWWHYTPERKRTLLTRRKDTHSP